MYLVFKRMPGESYRRRHRSLLLYMGYVFRAPVNSLVQNCVDSSESTRLGRTRRSPSNSSNRIIKGRNHSGFPQRSKARREQHMQTMTGTRKPGLPN